MASDYFYLTGNHNQPFTDESPGRLNLQDITCGVCHIVYELQVSVAFLFILQKAIRLLYEHVKEFANS